MIGAAGSARTSGPRRPATPRVALVAGIAGAHLSAILALLEGASTNKVRPSERLLAAFDVVAPPPPPPPPPPPQVRPPPLPMPKPAGRSGGSPGRERERATQQAADTAPDRRSTFEATINETTLSIAPSTDGGGSAPIDLGLGGDAGIGTGSGHDRGDGSGAGKGTGSGAGGKRIRWARAEWIVYPSPYLVNRYVPVAARAAGQSGFVRLACTVTRVGRPDHCRIVTENPKGFSFGEASLAMVPIFRIRPVRRNGRIVTDMPVMVPIQFIVKAKSPPPALTAAASAPRAR